MNKLLHLFRGELLRLLKYKILIFSLIVSAIWVVVIALTDSDTAKSFMPFLVLMDAGLMSIVLLSANFFYEKQEGTLQGVMVTPISIKIVLLAKVLAMVVVALISFGLVIGSALIFHEFPVAVWRFLIFTVLVVLSHTAIGYVLTLNSKDFMQTLTRYMGLMLLFIVPIILSALNIIPEKLDFLLLLSPTYSGQILFQGTLVSVPLWKTLLACGYLILIPALLYPLVIIKRYEAVAVEG
jgi:ABC-type multidrug transport system permease subunit